MVFTLLAKIYFMGKENTGNIFKVDHELPSKYEIFDEYVSTDNVLIERIISTGQSTPEGTWLEQDRDEWVVLLKGEAELSFENGKKFILKEGDYVLIPSGMKHRVDKTGEEPYCLWLAFHGKFKEGV